MNSNSISNGVVATLSVSLAGSTPLPVNITNSLGASATGDAISITGTGGTVSVAGATTALTSIACSPGAVATGASSTCTVVLSGSGGGAVSLSSSSTSLTVPASITIPAGSSSGTFLATATSFTTDQTATLTATLNGSSVTANVSLVAPLTISGITSSAITASGATITWTTNKTADSQVAYGLTATYGSVSPLAPAPLTSHSINLTPLAPSSPYHYQVISHDSLGNLTQSADLTFTTLPAGQQIFLQLHSDASEVSGVTNGSIVTPAVAPPGFTGNVVVNGSGSVNFAPAQSGNGVYFLQCCDNMTNAYYKFSGATIGSIFNAGQGQISFYLKSRQSFAQRLASNTSFRQVLDVRDASTHLFAFNTTAANGYLRLNYTLAGTAFYYFPPVGTEETLFGNGVTLKVTMSWDGSTAKLYLNDRLVQQAPYTATTPNWTAASVFDFGAYEYLTSGGYDSSDDVIDEFTVSSLSAPVVAPTVSSLQCAAASLTSNASTTCTVTLVNSTTAGTAVTLTNTAPSVLTVPSSVTVPANAASATFTATTNALVTNQAATVTAALNGSSAAATLSLVAPIIPATLSNIQCAAARLTSNASTACTVTLTKSTTGTTVVALSDSASSMLTVPSSVSVPANAASATFTAVAGTLLSDQAATVSATLNGSSVSANVSLVAPLTISGITSSAITASGATITWTTNKNADSQVAYGLAATYGSVSALAPALVTSHSVNVTGLVASTIYHYKVLSHDSLGNLTQSGDFTFTTSAPPGPQILLQLHSDASEVSGVTNGSTVTPSITPAGFKGNVVVTGSGSVNFAPAQSGNGVYFMKCCDNSTNAYYKFTGATVGSVFNVKQGQISFYLKSRQSFAQRLASATSFRQVLDVRDANSHQFQFNTQASYGYLRFGYTLAGTSMAYILPAGTEEALFGNGVILKVTMTWDGSLIKLYLNDNLVQQSPYTATTPNWTAASVFDFGAYEYLTFGGYDSSDDIIDEFTVTGPAITPSPLVSPASITRKQIETSTRPVITRLQNGAGEAAPAACSPAAVASLVGQFPFEDAAPVSDRSGNATALAGARVLINGSYAPVLYVSSDRVDFLCPAVPPSTSLNIAVETAAGLSNAVETRVEEASPGIFTGESAVGPAGTMSLRATGMNWLAKFPSVRALIRIGTQHLPIDSITPDPQVPGVSTITVTLPSDASDDSVPTTIEVVQTDGRSVSSNPVSIPVETRRPAAANPLIMR